LYTSAIVAAVRNRLYAIKASRKGQPGLARLLKALESSESAHARRFLMYLRGKTGLCEEYLAAYLRTKQSETIPGYTEMAEHYKQAGMPGKVENFHQFAKVVAAQTYLMGRYQDEKEGMTGEVHVCQICGFITAVEPPGNCPICNAVNSKFKHFT
jgi:rubrerythrin